MYECAGRKINQFSLKIVIFAFLCLIETLAMQDNLCGNSAEGGKEWREMISFVFIQSSRH